MKIAICFSGQPRFIKEGYTFLKKNLVGFDDMDIFFHSWTEKPLAGNNHHLTRHDNIEEILKLYNVVGYLGEPQKYDIAPEGVSHEVFVHYSMFYSILAANKVKEKWEEINNFKYDYVIRTRFDVALLEKLDISKIIDEKIIYSPDVCGNKRVISDWFNFSYSEVIDKYTNIFPFMNKFADSGVVMTSGEEIFMHQLNKIDLDYKKIKCKLALIRNGDEDISDGKFWVGANSLKNYL